MELNSTVLNLFKGYGGLSKRGGIRIREIDAGKKKAKIVQRKLTRGDSEDHVGPVGHPLPGERPGVGEAVHVERPVCRQDFLEKKRATILGRKHEQTCLKLVTLERD